MHFYTMRSPPLPYRDTEGGCRFSDHVWRLPLGVPNTNGPPDRTYEGDGGDSSLSGAHEAGSRSCRRTDSTRCYRPAPEKRFDAASQAHSIALHRASVFSSRKQLPVSFRAQIGLESRRCAFCSNRRHTCRSLPNDSARLCESSRGIGWNGGDRVNADTVDRPSSSTMGRRHRSNCNHPDKVARLLFPLPSVTL